MQLGYSSLDCAKMIRYPIISPISLSSLQISHIKSYCSQKDKDSSVQIYLLRGTYNAKQYNALVHNPLSQKGIYFFVFRISMHEVNIFIRLVSSVHSMQWEGDSMNGLLILTRNIGHIESSQRERAATIVNGISVSLQALSL